MHHASKRQHSQPGQALRGSSDLHAFGDSNAYLARRQDRLVLTLEHRTAKPIDPLELQLITGPDERSAHLEVVSKFKQGDTLSLSERIRQLLKNNPEPLKRTHIRTLLKVNNQRLGNALAQLEKQGSIIRHAGGYKEVKTETGQCINKPVPEEQLSIEACLKTPSLEDRDAFH